MKSRFSFLDITLGIIMLGALWQVCSLLISRPIIPAPAEVVPCFASLMTGELGLHFAASAARVTSALVLGALIGIPCGLMLGQFRWLDRLFSPLVAVLYSVPKIVFLPVIYVLMGITDLSKVLLIALIVFFQIIVVVRDEARGLSAELILSVRSLGAGRRALLRFVYLPACLPAVITAIRLSTGTAVAVLFIAEQSLTTYGLGYFIVVEAYQVLRYKEMFAGIMAMGLLGLIFHLILEASEKRLSSHSRLTGVYDKH